MIQFPDSKRPSRFRPFPPLPNLRHALPDPRHNAAGQGVERIRGWATEYRVMSPSAVFLAILNRSAAELSCWNSETMYREDHRRTMGVRRG